MARAAGRASPNSLPVSPGPPVLRPRARSRARSSRLRFAAIREAAAPQGLAEPPGTASPASRQHSPFWTPLRSSAEKRGGQGGASSGPALPEARVPRKPRASTEEGPAPRPLAPGWLNDPLPRGRGRGGLYGDLRVGKQVTFYLKSCWEVGSGSQGMHSFPFGPRCNFFRP